MELRTFCRVAGSVKVLAAVIGAGNRGRNGCAITIANGDDEVATSTASTNGLPVASVTLSTAPTELAT